VISTYKKYSIIDEKESDNMNSMIDRLDAIENRYKELNDLLIDPEVTSDVKKIMQFSKELSGIKETVEVYRQYKEVLEGIEEAKMMLDDPEMGELAEEELKDLQPQVPEIEGKLEILLIPKDPNDEKNVIVEIRGAAGGAEANIFAGDLYRMYSRYAETMDWKISVINATEADSGGYSQIEFMVSGEKVYSHLKYESGAHRVQRVPQTESQGRIHTSTATVLVMPEAEEVDVELNMNDVRIDAYRSSGAGGQSVNTTDSAARVTHIPTGLVATCQDGKSLHANKDKALQILRARLYDLKLREQEEKLGSERRSKIGTGDRSEKIRTYNYPQNRVTDHQISFTLQQLDRVMEGKLGTIIDALINEDQRRKLAGE